MTTNNTAPKSPESLGHCNSPLAYSMSAANPMPPTLAEYLREQEQLAAELTDLLRLLSEQNDSVAMSLAYRLAGELLAGLDPIDLKKLGRWIADT